MSYCKYMVSPGYEIVRQLLVLGRSQIPATIHFRLSKFFSSPKNVQQHHWITTATRMRQPMNNHSWWFVVIPTSVKIRMEAYSLQDFGFDQTNMCLEISHPSILLISVLLALQIQQIKSTFTYKNMGNTLLNWAYDWIWAFFRFFRYVMCY